MNLVDLPANRWARRLLGLVAGLLICASVPPFGWWPLALIGIAVWALLLEGGSGRDRFWIGVLVGMGWFVPSTVWMLPFTPAGWPLGVSIWFPLIIGLTSLACTGRSTWVLLPAAVTLSEWVRWHAPFGGVPLSMLAMSQGAGPLLPIARVFGSLGVSTAVAFGGTTLAALATRRTRTAGAVGAAVLLLVAVLSVFAPDGDPEREIRVAAVQGGGEQQTISALTNYDEVLQRHLDAARTIEGPVDLVLLPENIVNVNGFYEGSAQQARVDQLAIDLGTNVVSGIVEDRNSPRHFWNAAVSINAEGETLDRYDKVRRVPFGEYVPLRFLVDKVAADRLPRRDDKEGSDPAVLDSELGPLGTVISWEVFFPRRVRSGMDEGAKIILNPTNGSSYWLTQVQAQQIASSSLRAVESGRWLLQAAPTGFSAIVDPAGNVVQRSSLAEQTVLVDTVELRTGTTLAMWWGEWPVLLGSIAGLVAGWTPTRRRDNVPETASKTT